MEIKKIVFVLVTLLAVGAMSSGCAVMKRVDIADNAKSELVGLSKTDLLSCAGVPVRSETVGDMEFLTYVSESDKLTLFRRGKRYCEVTFTLKNGIVENVSYAGNTGGRFTKGEQCAYILESCMAAEAD